MKRKKIAIISDIGIDQRLIAKLIKINGAELVVIPKEISIHQDMIGFGKNEIIKRYKNDHLKMVRKIMNDVDGLILPGNKYDINPIFYNENKIHPRTHINPNPFDIRYDVERAMFLRALKREIPILAICAGMQLVNVILGGTLNQHLPDSENGVTHKLHQKLENKVVRAWEGDFESNLLLNDSKNIYAAQAHNIAVKLDSNLGRIYKKSNPKTNLSQINELSIHHQGCFKENLSNQLKIVATSADGLVEAVELIDYPSVFIATQYHFEYNVGNIASKLFEELVF